MVNPKTGHTNNRVDEQSSIKPSMGSTVPRDRFETFPCVLVKAGEDILDLPLAAGSLEVLK